MVKFQTTVGKVAGAEVTGAGIGLDLRQSKGSRSGSYRSEGPRDA